MSRAIPLSPALMLAGANTLVAMYEHLPKRRSQIIGHIARRVPPGAAWNVAFVHHVGHWAHYDHRAARSGWPLPPVRDCDALAKFAAAHGILSDGEPRAGEIFLLWSRARGRFEHAGIVGHATHTHVLRTREPYVECVTLEGSIEGIDAPSGAMGQRTRRLSPALGDRFVRWVDLDGLAALTKPVVTRDELCRVAMLREMRPERAA